MKIGIIGAGSASAIFLLSVYDFMNRTNTKLDITCIYDPKVPIAAVGEGGSSPVLKMLTRVVDFLPLVDLEKIDGTIRWGTKYFWKEAYQDFTVPYPTPAFHFNSAKFSPFVISRLKQKYKNLTEIHDNIVTVDSSSGIVSGIRSSYQFDWVIDARGTPSAELLDSDQYSTPAFQAINSAIIFPEFKKYDEPYTSAHIHKNGWMFGIPLSHRKAWGYLYNNTITSFEEAKEEFKAIKGLTDEQLEKCNKFTWKQYYKKKAITGKVLSLGNRLYFFEPTQALPLHYYMDIGIEFLENLFNPDVENYINRYHASAITDIETLIALNYQGINNIDSVYWKSIPGQAYAVLKNYTPWHEWIKFRQHQDYSYHSAEIIHEYIRGLGINLGSYLTA